MPDCATDSSEKQNGKECKQGTLRRAFFLGVSTWGEDRIKKQMCAGRNGQTGRRSGEGLVLLNADQEQANAAKDGTTGMSRRGAKSQRERAQSNISRHECKQRKPICIEANQTLYK